MMTDTYKGLEDGRDKLDRLTDLPINVIHQVQEYMTLEDATRMSVLSIISRDEVPQNGQHEAINLMKLLSSWPELRKLLLDRYFIKFLSSGNVAGLLSTRLNDLHDLAFCDYDFNDEDQVCSLLCVLRSSPNLKSLVLVLSHIKKGSGEVDVNHLEGQGCRIGEFNNLLALRICYFHGSRVEMLFVRLLLASAPFLQEIIIEVDKKVSESQATKISEELMQFPRPALTQVMYHR
ncbi:PREDICTED: F-box/FBD/LRR-repeat protein At1g13570-like isoform X2 [Nicotiana attenuata]|uniref:F-box/FBD/LRR-repeat protein At1g13570-like isoform X2 n=1 Tax=Nicotiana attenuata TaxID=49451 RepID=UPI000904BCCC|nr:PREDICTED: F-box/FBD/LRR-repeat protein At1g13570-like isoform X2 [Nicotiana attenuata]